MVGNCRAQLSRTRSCAPSSSGSGLGSAPSLWNSPAPPLSKVELQDSVSSFNLAHLALHFLSPESAATTCRVAHCRWTLPGTQAPHSCFYPVLDYGLPMTAQRRLQLIPLLCISGSKLGLAFLLRAASRIKDIFPLQVKLSFFKIHAKQLCLLLLLIFTLSFNNNCVMWC